MTSVTDALTHRARSFLASESAWPSTRRAYGLAHRTACRHARQSTAKPRDAVHAPHGQVGPSPPTGAARRPSPALLTSAVKSTLDSACFMTAQ